MSDSESFGPIKLVAGLGNPGVQYRHTRHNVGFRALDRVAEKLGVELVQEKFRGLTAEAMAGGRRVLLVKPLTYMNKSGESLALAARNKVDHPSQILVLYDEVELPLGRLRLRKTGSAGTHNGMKSVVERLGSRDVPRIRMGVGDNRRGADLAEHVLSGFRPEERETVDEMIERSAEAVLSCLEDGLEKAMNTFNR